MRDGRITTLRIAMKTDAIQAKRLRDEFQAAIQSDRKTVKCPYCGDLHGLWYRVGSGGKKSLCFTCNRAKSFWYEEGKERFRTVTRTYEAPVFIDGLPIQELWTPGRRVQEQKAAQQQLPLMKK